MSFDLTLWKEKISQQLQGWKKRFDKAGSDSVYYFLAAISFLPIVQAVHGGDWGALTVLGTTLGSAVGTNLLANIAQRLKDKNEIEVAQELTTEIKVNPNLKAELDALLEKLETLPNAEQTLSEDEKAWFADTIKRELAQLNSSIKYEARLNGDGAITQGEGNVAVGKGGVFGKNVEDSAIVTGNQNIVGNNNVVIHIYDKIFDMRELRNLVSSSLDMKTLHDLQNRMFLTREPIYQEQITSDSLIAEIKRQNELPLLFSEVKKTNPDAFRKFLFGQALGAIGMSQTDIPDTGSVLTLVKEDLSLAGETSKLIPRGEDIEVPFINKEPLFAQIHNHVNNYIVVYGPGGVGKTYFLQNFREKFSDSRCVYIDLKSCDAADILSEAVRQLKSEEEPNPKATYTNLARAINSVHLNNPYITRFFFLFDSSDKNQAAVDFIFSPNSLIDNKSFYTSLKNLRIYDRIEIKIVLAARKQIKPRELDSPFQNSVQIKYDALSRDSVQSMLEKLANKDEILVFPDMARFFSDKVYYLTGGHPGCVKPMLLALKELDYAEPEPETWVELYRQYVLPVIEDEMLSGVKQDTKFHIWNLCIFRRLDQRLLGGLIDRGILSCPPGENSRMARELRPQLDQTQLFETDRTTSTMVMNYTLRHALSLNMQYESPERYKALHALALEMFLDRLQSLDITSNKAAERIIMHLFEIVYHWTKILELNTTVTETPDSSDENCTRLLNAFFNYLALSFVPYRRGDPTDFLRLLDEWWTKDQELHEMIQQVTDYGDCCEKMTTLIKQFVEENGQNEDSA